MPRFQSMSSIASGPSSVLEAIRMKHWDYEPSYSDLEDFSACGSMPGTAAKLSALAERVSRGQPLWHPGDCQDAEDLLHDA